MEHQTAPTNYPALDNGLKEMLITPSVAEKVQSQPESFAVINQEKIVGPRESEMSTLRSECEKLKVEYQKLEKHLKN